MLALNNKRIAGGICFDLEEAFDCVNHNVLLAKMEYYGTRGVMYTLIKSYLENRHQKVKFNDKLSKWDKFNIGVPQGSILGTLFFLIYTNDLPSVIPYTVSNKNSSIVLFAGGTSVLFFYFIYIYFWPWNTTLHTDLDIYTGFIPSQLMTNTSGCCYSL